MVTSNSLSAIGPVCLQNITLQIVHMSDNWQVRETSANWQVCEISCPRIIYLQIGMFMKSPITKLSIRLFCAE